MDWYWEIGKEEEIKNEKWAVEMNRAKVKKIGASDFICLRCGRCCVELACFVPRTRTSLFIRSLSLKKDGEVCKYLVQARIKIPKELKVDSKWRMASCKIYKRRAYPQDCKLTYFGSRGICSMGKEIWRKRSQLAPLPPEIKHSLYK